MTIYTLTAEYKAKRGQRWVGLNRGQIIIKSFRLEASTFSEGLHYFHSVFYV